MALFRRPAAPRSSGGLALGSRDLQQLWFATLKHAWSSLVVMDTHPGGGAHKIARALAEIGSLHRGSPVHVIDAHGVELGRAVSIITDMTSHVLNGGMVVVAADAVAHSQAGVPVAMAADAVLLVVTLGRTELSAVERTVELVGRERILGTVTLEADAA